MRCKICKNTMQSEVMRAIKTLFDPSLGSPIERLGWVKLWYCPFCELEIEEEMEEE